MSGEFEGDNRAERRREWRESWVKYKQGVKS